MVNNDMKLLTAFIVFMALVLGGCTTTQTALTATTTASDIKYVMVQYPHISQQVAQLDVPKDQKTELQTLLEEVEQSHAYFQQVNIQNVDINQVINEYMVLKETYSEIRDIVEQADIDDVRTRVELTQFDSMLIRIDNNLQSIFDDESKLDQETLVASQSIAKSIMGILRIVVI